MAGNDERTVRVRIKGRVQGVGYRAWVARGAGELALSGWVRNCRDGSVEAVLCGASDKVGQMIARCRAGPPSAAVSAVSVVEEDEPPAHGFGIVPTA